MPCILNIGGHPADAPAILEAAIECDLNVNNFEFQDDTFVLDVTLLNRDALMTDCVHRLTYMLGRDCIAMLNGGLPYLVGDGREKYMPFDMAKFKNFIGADL
jgi:hypothetical protein